MFDWNHPIVQAHRRKDEALLCSLYSFAWGWSHDLDTNVFYKQLAQIIDEEIREHHKPQEEGTAENFLYEWARLDRQIERLLLDLPRFPTPQEEQIFEAQVRTCIAAIQLLVFTVIGARCEVVRADRICLTILEVENSDRSTRGMYGHMILPGSFMFLDLATQDPLVKKRR